MRGLPVSNTGTMQYQTPTTLNSTAQSRVTMQYLEAEPHGRRQPAVPTCMYDTISMTRLPRFSAMCMLRPVPGGRSSSPPGGDGVDSATSRRMRPLSTAACGGGEGV